jgi:predicted MFS family arabinose efflux permease
LRRAGLVRGVAATQLACALALASLAVLPSVALGLAAAGLAYAAYMGFHYMGEPGLYSLLMNRVPRTEHSGASSLNHLAMFSAQAVAATIAGAAVTRVGYSAVMLAAALMAALAALLLWRLLDEPAE